ncbi:MAG: ABC transporter ATP-binding protein [Thermoplasmata archaeon]
MISIENLTVRKQYRKDGNVINNLNVEFKENKNIIIGPNGSGKTTLLKAILGIVKYEGNITCYKEGGRCIFSTNIDQVYKLYNDSSGAIAKLYLEIIGGDFGLFIEIINRFRMQKILDTRIYKLSTGESKIFGLAMAFSLGSEYILIDEPTENLDHSRKGIAEELIIEHSARKYLLVTHDLKLIRRLNPDKFFIMVSGKLHGGFNPEDYSRIYFSKNKKENSIGELISGPSQYYLTLDKGDFPLYSFSNMEEILGGE